MESHLTYCYHCGRKEPTEKVSVLIDWSGKAKVYAERPLCNNCAEIEGGFGKSIIIAILGLGLLALVYMFFTL